MTIRMSTALRSARAQAIIDALDAAATAGTCTLWSGGQPDPDAAVDAIPAHATDTAYTAGDYVAASGHYYRAENAGTSASTAPVWPTDGGTVADGDITWQDMGETPMQLGTLTLSQPCGAVTTTTLDGAVALVALEFAAITEDASADASNIASWCRFADGNGNPVLDGSVGTTGADFIINTTNVVTGGPIRIKSGTTPKLIEPGS